MKQLRPRVSTKAGILAAATAFAVLCVSASAFAATYPEGTASPQASSVPTVFIKADSKGLRFVAPKTVVTGEELKIVNQTDPHKVGPHTFSLVTKGSLPKTGKARQLCFTPKHICKAIAAWHGVKGNGPVKINPAEAGNPGWDTLGSVSKKGDSWFTGEKPGTSFSQPVSVDTSAGASRIYFICAIHSFMQGSINVLPGG
ncbi:MAG TPA: hypothetical protein VN756_06990 [Solirubrobacterales bacterium]|nr:hypothetical protein [Solirubrobacterales bacterium]